MLAITGITGHSGRFLISQLQEHNYSDRIRFFVRESSNTSFITESTLNYELFLGDLEKESDLRLFLSGIDIVLHIANIHYSPDIVRIGKECGVKRYILVHTTGIFSKYKSAAEEYIHIESLIMPLLKELNITILRPTMIFGDICDYNISKFIKIIDLFPIVPIVADGKALIQPVNARDLGSAYYQVILSEKCIGKAYNLSGDRPLSIKELYELIMMDLGKKKVIVSFPLPLSLFIARIIKFLSFGKCDITEKILRMNENRSFSHESAREDFGYQPELFEIGLEREIHSYLSNKKVR